MLKVIFCDEVSAEMQNVLTWLNEESMTMAQVYRYLSDWLYPSVWNIKRKSRRIEIMDKRLPAKRDRPTAIIFQD